MAEVVSLVLALPLAIEQIAAAGRNLAERVEAARSPRSSFGKLPFFLQGDQKLKAQFQVANQICNDPNVDPDVKESLARDFEGIQRTMLDAVRCMEGVENSGRLQRFWMADKARKSLVDKVTILERLSNHFQDTTQLVYLSASLPSRVLLQPEKFQLAAAAESVQVAEGVFKCRGNLAQPCQQTQPKMGWFICERRPYDEAAKSAVEGDIRSLSELLSKSAASRGILSIVGYRDQPATRHFELVFDLPDEIDPVLSLRDLIRTARNALALDVRVDLCRQLADAVLQIHRLKLVHKNVSSANVMVSTNPEGDPEADSHDRHPLCKAFLVNWHLVRRASAASQLRGEPRWWKGLYLHPTRQLLLAEKEYTMEHDIYSLGVCFLEILLWTPLVVHRDGEPPTPSEPLKSEALHLQIATAAEWDNICHRAAESSLLIDPTQLQKVLVTMAKRRLPAACGSRLTQLVVSCLDVLDGGFGDGNIFRRGRLETGLNFVSAVKEVLLEVSL